MGINVTIDATELISGIAVFTEKLMRYLNETLKFEFPRIQEVARTWHRYKSRTGLLNSAIREEVRDLVADIFIDDTIADYGKYVHEGHGTWRPDPFIDSAVAYKDEELMYMFESAVERAARESGF